MSAPQQLPPTNAMLAFHLGIPVIQADAKGFKVYCKKKDMHKVRRQLTDKVQA